MPILSHRAHTNNVGLSTTCYCVLVLLLLAAANTAFTFDVSRPCCKGVAGSLFGPLLPEHEDNAAGDLKSAGRGSQGVQGRD